jgi:hypothetical protein
MNPKRRRELMLAGAAILLIAVAAWGVQRTSAPRSQEVAPSGMPPVTAAQSPAGNHIAAVDLDALGAKRPEPDDSTRNPFRFKPKAPPPPSAAILKQQQQQAAAEQAARGPVEPPPPPRIPLKYIGDMADPTNPGKRIAILSDARGTYYGREGEVLEGRYRIVRIGVESIELTYLDGRGRQTIRQTGQ